MIRWLLYRFIPFYVFLTALMAGLMLLFSETGLNWLWQQAKPHLPDGLQVESVQGRLLGKVHVRGVRLENPQMKLDIAQAWLDWSPWALLDGRIVIQDISVIGVRYEQLQAAPEKAEKPTTPSLPSLPSIQLRSVQLRDVEVLNNGQSLFQLNRAQLQATHRRHALHIELSQFDARDIGRWQAELDAQLKPNQITLHALNLSTPDAPDLAAKIAGQCAWPALHCSLAADWQQLRWPLDSTALRSQRGSLQLQQKTDQLDFNLAAELSGEKLPASTLSASGDLPAQGKTLNLAAIWQAKQALPDGSKPKIQIDGSYQLDSTALKGRLDFSALDGSWWLSDWPSKLQGSGAVSGQIIPSLKLRSENLTIQGTLRKQPLSTDLAGHWHGLNDWALKRGQLVWGDNQLDAQVAHRSTWNGELKLRAPALEQLDPQLSGALQVDVNLSGQQAIPKLVWTVSGKNLQLADLELERLESQGHYSDKALKQKLTLSDMHGYGVILNSLTLDSTGSPENAQHSMQLDEARAAGQLKFVSRWHVQTQKLNIQLDSGEWLLGPEPRNPKLGWRLQQAGRLVWHKDKFKLDRQCWHSVQASSCLQAEWQDEKLSAQLALQGYTLDRVQALLPRGTLISGDLDLHIDVAPSPLAQLQSELRLNTRQIEIQVQQGKQLQDVLTLLPGELSAQFAGAQGQAQWTFPVAGNVQSQGLDGYLNLDDQQQISGQLNLLLEDLSIISAVSSEVLNSSGRLQGRLELSGSANKPSLAGELNINNAQLDLDRPNLQLKQLEVSLKANGDQPMLLIASTHSGEGYLKLDGQWNWQDPSSRLKAHIRGDRFLAVDTSQAQVLVSPDLKLQASLPDIQLRGRIDIPQANIQPRELNQRSAITPDADQRIVGQEQAIEKALRIDSEVSLVLGDNVAFEGLGLTTDLQGRLVTRMKPGQVATGLGDLRLVNGRYKAYGQDLRIEKGRLIFSGGPLTEPGLDVKAFRQANADVRAGVIVRGPINKPQVSLYSDPDMRETDQLSYLVLGRAAEAKSENDQAALNNAALALGLKGGDFLAKRFKRQLGLDEVSIGTQPGEESSQASLVLGKYLSPDIYVSYGIGLFEPVYTFKLRYRLSSKWSLQTESGVESGGDLFYSIER